MLKTPVCRAYVLGRQQHTTTLHVIPEDTHPEEERCANSKIAFYVMLLFCYRLMYKVRKKAIMKQIREAKQLASDLNVDEIQLRKMISRIFAMTGVSESWLTAM